MRFAYGLIVTIICMGQVAGQETEPKKPNQKTADNASLEEQRMDLMRSHATDIQFATSDKQLPKQVQAEPLFRYDDVPRGYLDGAVWRWGDGGRPLAIVTTELHPRYLGSGPRIVYDFLSLSDFSFSAISDDSSWRPSTTAVQMKDLPDQQPPAETAAQRLFQMKRIMRRFSADQVISLEPPQRKLSLRLLPRPIDRYQTNSDPRSDGATFLFVAGRMPGVIVFLDTNGKTWTYGVGRLSAPSTLRVSIDNENVYSVDPDTGSWNSGYTASNSPVKIPELHLPELSERQPEK